MIFFNLNIRGTLAANEDNFDGLFDAASVGDLAKIKLLLEIGCHLNVQNKFGDNIAHIAIRNKQPFDFIKEFFALDLSIFRQFNNEGRSPFFEAVYNEQYELAMWLFQIEKTLILQIHTLAYVFDWIVKIEIEGKHAQVKFLLENCLEFLLEFGENLHLRDSNTGNSLIIIAARYSAKAVKELLENGAYVNDQNKANATALQQIFFDKRFFNNSNESYHERFDIVYWLISHGVWIDIRFFDNIDSENTIFILNSVNKRINKNGYSIESLIKSLKESPKQFPFYLTDIDNHLLKHLVLGEFSFRLNQLLVDAAEKGDIVSVRTSLDHRACVNAHDIRENFLGMTALHWAAEHGWIEIMELLLEAGANKEEAMAAGITPLGIAVHAGQREAVRILISKGANLHALSADGRGVLYLALQGLFNGHHKNRDSAEWIVLHLLGHGVSIDIKMIDGESIMTLSEKLGFKRITELLQLCNAFLMVLETENLEEIRKEINRIYSLPMYMISTEQSLENTVQKAQNALILLRTNNAGFRQIAKRAEISLANWSIDRENEIKIFELQLLLACQNNDIEEVRWLLSKGANPNTKWKGKTPLYYAISLNITLLLLERGATMICPDLSLTGNAINDRNVELLKSLQEYKEDLKRFISEKKRTLKFDYNLELEPYKNYKAIHLAAWYGDNELLELFNEQGQLNFNDLSSSGENLLHCAVVNNQIEVIHYLLSESPGLIFKTNNNGETPLHYAAHYGYGELVSFLIDKDSDFTFKNTAGETPGDVARKVGHGDLSQWLYQKELIHACYTNNLEEIKRVAPLLGDKLVNTVDAQGNNPLMIMLLKSNQEAVKYFLGKTPGLHNKVTQELRNAKNNQRNTIIHLAAALPNNKSFNFLSYIIKDFPDLYSQFNAKNKMDQTPLDVAVEHHQYENVRLLIPYFDELHKILYASSSFNVIERCVASGDIGCLKVFVDAKKTFAKHFLWILEKNLLWIAVEFNQLPVLAYLLNLEDHHFLDDAQRQRLAVDVKGKQENLFLLNYAALLGRADIIEMLVRRYTINFAHTTKEKSALHRAIEGADLEPDIYLETVKVILALDKSLENLPFERTGASGRVEFVTPLNYAIELERTAISNIITMTTQSTGQVFQDELEKPEIPRNLVFQGGGAKGLAHMGALRNLATRLNGFDNIDRVAGTSAGAITAALLAVGYTLDELEKELSQKDFADFLDLSNLNVPQKNTFSEWGKALFGYAKCVYDSGGIGLGLLSCAASKTIEQGGLCTGEAFLQWMEEMVYNKTKIHHFTLGDLVNGMNQGRGYKHLSVATVKVGKNKTEGKVFSSEEIAHREVILSDLIRMSMSIPGVFQPHYLYQRVTNSDSGKKERVEMSKEGYYIDGGVFWNYPLEIFDYQKFQLGSLAKDHPLYNPETLGFVLLDDNVENADDQEKNLSERLWLKLKGKIKDKIEEQKLMGLIRDLFSAYYQHESISRSFKPQSSYEVRTVSIHCNVGTLDFGMSLEQKKELLRRGAEAVNEFYSNSLNPEEDYDGHTPAGSAWPLPGGEARKLPQHIDTMLLEDELEEANDEIIEPEELQVSSAARLSSPWSSLFMLPMALMHGTQLFVPSFSSTESQNEQGEFEEHFETRQYDETIPDYHSSITEQLPLLRLGMHYLSDWLPWNQLRELTDIEKARLEAHQQKLEEFNQQLNEFNDSIIADCGLFEEQLNWLDNNIRAVKLKIHSILNKDDVTQSQWDELIHKVANIENELSNLCSLQEKLLILESESARLAVEGKRNVISYDFIYHKLKVTTESIEIEKALIPLSSWELPGNTLFAHRQQLWQAVPTRGVEELPEQPSEIRKLMK